MTGTVTRAKKIAFQIHDQRLLGAIHHNLGRIEYLENRLQSAIYYYEKSLEIKKDLPIEDYVYTLYVLVEISYNQGNLERCLHWVNHALKLINDDGSLLNFKYHLEVYKFRIEGKEQAEEYEELLRDKVIPYFQKTGDLTHISEYC